MTVLIRTMALAAGVALAVASGVSAFAGGEDYDAANDTEGNGPSYFGFVRDARGSPVLNASVVLRPKAGEPVTIKTNVLGLYRTHVSKDVRPDEVEVSCAKDGYRQTQVMRRSGTKEMFVETNCTLQRL